AQRGDDPEQAQRQPEHSDPAQAAVGGRRVPAVIGQRDERGVTQRDKQPARHQNARQDAVDRRAHRRLTAMPAACAESAWLISSPYLTRYVGMFTDARSETTIKLEPWPPKVLASIATATHCTLRVTMLISACTQLSSVEGVIAMTVLLRANRPPSASSSSEKGTSPVARIRASCSRIFSIWRPPPSAGI